MGTQYNKTSINKYKKKKLMNVQPGRLAGNQPQTPRANYKKHINFIPLDSNLCESVFVFTSIHINYTVVLMWRLLQQRTIIGPFFEALQPTV